MLRSALLVVLATTLAAAEDKKDPKAAAYLGKWDIVGMEIGGTKLPDEELKKVPSSITMTGDAWTLKIGDQTSKGTYKLDTSKKPHEMDTTETEGANKGQMLKGITEVSGDTMKACFDKSDKARPKEFSTKDQPTCVMILYKKAK